MSTHVRTLEASGRKRPGLAVIGVGLATTVFALLLVYVLNTRFEIEVMGLYLWFIVPISAIGIGALAGSGYGVASWLTGAKIGAGLLVAVLGLQFIAYFVAQYLEYMSILAGAQEAAQETGEPFEAFGFFEYFDYMTQSFAFQGRHADQPGKPLGMLGYGVRALEVGGFMLGGVIAPAILRSVPYCDACQTYMKGRVVALIPATTDRKAPKKKDAAGQAAFEATTKEVLEQAQQSLDLAMESAAGGDVQTFTELIATYEGDRKQTAKLPAHIELKVSHCPRCLNGFVAATMITGKGDKQKREELARAGVDSELVAAVM